MPGTCAQIWHQGGISAISVCVGVMELRIVLTWIDLFLNGLLVNVYCYIGVRVWPQWIHQ
jgi:hypothetical protein